MQVQIKKLYEDNKLIHEELGEIQFKDDGISGIVIMNIASKIKTSINTLLVVL